MNMKFAKVLLTSSVFAMSTFGLVACNSGSSSSAKEPSQGDPIEVPTTQDQIIQFNDLTMVDAGTMVKLVGSVSLNATDTISSTVPENIQFKGIDFSVGKVGTAGLQVTNANVQVGAPATFPTQKALAFTEMNVIIDFADQAFTECGDFQLIITAQATDGIKEFENTQRVSFNRPNTYCAAVPTSSSGSEQPVNQIEMTSYNVTLNTEFTPSLDLAAGTTSTSTTADIMIVKSGSNDFSIKSGNGTLFASISNGDDYFVKSWPEDEHGTAYMSDFKYKVITGASIDNLVENDMGSIYVAKTTAFNQETGAGFYAFAVTAKTSGNNNEYTVTLKVYKAK